MILDADKEDLLRRLRHLTGVNVEPRFIVLSMAPLW